MKRLRWKVRLSLVAACLRFVLNCFFRLGQRLPQSRRQIELGAQAHTVADLHAWVQENKKEFAEEAEW